MDSQAMFLNCPAYMDKDGGTRCGLPAEVEYRYTMNSTDGPLESAKISCPRRHHFNAPIEYLTLPEQRCDHRISQPAASSDRSKRTTARPTGGRKTITPPIWANYPLALLFLSAWGWHPAADDLAAAHAYLPAQAALATMGSRKPAPATTWAAPAGPAKNHPPARPATGRSAR